MVRVSIFAGDITEADTEAICTSTNRRLTLVMGTGAAVRERGGYEILRACEEIVARKGPLDPGSAYATTAGELPHKIVIHCVASDAAHRSSDDIIRMCVRNAIACAEKAGCRSVAMPVFAAGHASILFSRSLAVMSDALLATDTSLQHAVIVVNDQDRVEEASVIVSTVFPDVAVVRSQVAPAARIDWWSDDDMFGR